MVKKVLPYFVARSPIHGRGIFANRDLRKNEDVGLGIAFNLGLFPYVTERPGSLINHSYHPNTYLHWQDDGWHIHTRYAVPRGKELTVDYNNTPWYIQGPLPHYV